MEVINSKALPAVLVRKYLRDLKEEEMNYGQKITYDFLNKHYKFKEKEVLEAMKELEALGIKDYQIAMILNFLPEEDDEVKAIFAKERNQPGEEERKKILEIVAKLL